jgi:probable HAF family extracellular repeat protein
MKQKSLHLFTISGILLLMLSCKKSTESFQPELKGESSGIYKKATESNASLPETNFSRGFSINNSGAIAGSVRNTDGKVVAFLVKDSYLWYSDEEVLPNGLPETKFSINDPGDVVGSKVSGADLIPMLWRHGQSSELQKLPGFQFGEVYDINNAGMMVGECWNGTFATATSARAVVFSQSSLPTDLGTLGGEGAAAVGVNEDGHIVGASGLTNGQSHAFLYREGVMYDLGTLGGTISNANAINNNGEIVGRSTLANGAIRGFLYKDGVMHDLGTLGGASSVAFDINDKGDIVGFSRISNGQARAFLYKDGVMHNLGALGGTDSRAIGINNKGEIVGHYTKTDGTVHAFIYRDSQMFPL